jgi:hypothetical protein
MLVLVKSRAAQFDSWQENRSGRSGRGELLPPFREQRDLDAVHGMILLCMMGGMNIDGINHPIPFID